MVAKSVSTTWALHRLSSHLKIFMLQVVILRIFMYKSVISGYRGLAVCRRLTSGMRTMLQGCYSKESDHLHALKAK